MVSRVDTAATYGARRGLRRIVQGQRTQRVIEGGLAMNTMVLTTGVETRRNASALFLADVR